MPFIYPELVSCLLCEEKGKALSSNAARRPPLLISREVLSIKSFGTVHCIQAMLGRSFVLCTEYQHFPSAQRNQPCFYYLLFPGLDDELT